MHLKRRATLAIGVGGALAGLIGRAAAQNAAGMMNRSYEDGFTVMASDPSLSTWVSFLQQSGLASYARGANPYTVFPPTNAAFDRYPNVVQRLLPVSGDMFPDTSRLIPPIRSHVIHGLHPLAEFQGKKVSYTSLSGNPIEIDGTDPQALTVTWTGIEGKTGVGKVEGQPILASNADIYPLDSVVLLG